ncbi:WXG100 family type VII secretion target [Streptomyces sp. NPDC048638]|uniref:WXG100 family type VII secretion target n=1 Tax=Streptomyces sp. NPDC048638 TaxID=3365580 RepID=UPI003720B4B1
MSKDNSTAPKGSYERPVKFHTPFNQHYFDALKSMVEDADVNTVERVAEHWQKVHDDLVDLQHKFEKAVKKVREHWEGDSSERFQESADQIIANFKAGAPWASWTAHQIGKAADSLQKAINKINSIDDDFNEINSWWEIDDEDLDKLLKSGADTAAVREANEEDLSDHQKSRLTAAVAMEHLGTSYMQLAKSLKAPVAGRVDEKIPEHKDPNGDRQDGIPMMPTGGMTGGGGGGGLKIPRRGADSGGGLKLPESPSVNQPGISGGLGELKPKGPDVGTGLDGLHGGGLKVPNGPGTGGLHGGGVHVPSGPTGPSGGSHMPVGMPGMPGGTSGLKGGASGLKGGSSGLKGGASGLKGGSSELKGGAPGTGPGGQNAGSGRAGMPGMGGMHGGAGKGGGAGHAGGGAGGALARQKGGTVGSPGGGNASGGAQGGSGLHRSRGGTASGGNSGGRRPAGMMGGAHGAPGAKGEGGGRDTSRPDYLMEEEETWTSRRNVAPPVIE